MKIIHKGLNVISQFSLYCQLYLNCQIKVISVIVSNTFCFGLYINFVFWLIWTNECKPHDDNETETYHVLSQWN
jgi:hypothetical protein